RWRGRAMGPGTAAQGGGAAGAGRLGGTRLRQRDRPRILAPGTRLLSAGAPVERSRHPAAHAVARRWRLAGERGKIGAMMQRALAGMRAGMAETPTGMAETPMGGWW